MPNQQEIYDGTGLHPLEEKLLVRPRHGKFRGQLMRLTYMRRTGHVRIYVQPLVGTGGAWMSPKSVEVVTS